MNNAAVKWSWKQKCPFSKRQVSAKRWRKGTLASCRWNVKWRSHSGRCREVPQPKQTQNYHRIQRLCLCVTGTLRSPLLWELHSGTMVTFVTASPLGTAFPQSPYLSVCYYHILHVTLSCQMGWSFHLHSGVVRTPNDSSAVGLIFFCALPNPKANILNSKEKKWSLPPAEWKQWFLLSGILFSWTPQRRQGTLFLMWHFLWRAMLISLITHKLASFGTLFVLAYRQICVTFSLLITQMLCPAGCGWC